MNDDPVDQQHYSIGYVTAVLNLWKAAATLNELIITLPYSMTFLKPS